MQVVSAPLVKGKRVLLRYDIDVPIGKSSDKFVVTEDFRLKAGLSTLQFCLREAREVIILGHIGRPDGEDPALSIEPIYNWFWEHGFKEPLESGKLKLLENLRFEAGEDAADMDYAKQLAHFGDVFVNEAFAAHHKAASTTVLPTLMPHAGGLRFAKEVNKLSQIRDDPHRPLITIIGGLKFEDKYPAIINFAKFSDTVLVGGLLPKVIKEKQAEVPQNVILGKLNDTEDDLSAASLGAFLDIIKSANQVIWAGPVGKDQNSSGFDGGNEIIARAILDSGAKSLIGGGDTIGILDKFHTLELFGFVSTGGGAMLEFLGSGTLPTIQALE